MTTSDDTRSLLISERRSVTVAGLFNERSGAFDLKPMFMSSQPATCIADRTEEIRKRAYFAAVERAVEADPHTFWLQAEQEFDTHTLHVVQRNAVYGYKVCMLPMDILCLDGAQLDDTFIFAGNIAYVPRVDAIDFYRDWRHLYRFEVPRAIPQIVLRWQPRDTPPEGKQVVSWQGRHSEGRSLFYYLTYEPVRGNREPLVILSEASEVEVDFSSLPSGVGRLVLTASDGYNTVESYSPRFYIPCRPCMALILSPTAETVIADGSINLSGQGLYDDGMSTETEALAWISDRDGTIGQGSLVTNVMLSPGKHHITLTAGLPGAQGTASIDVEVLPRPS
jgi:hypothetical protein